jgi:hypothetical protein
LQDAADHSQSVQITAFQSAQKEHDLSPPTAGHVVDSPMAKALAASAAGGFTTSFCVLHALSHPASMQADANGRIDTICRKFYSKTQGKISQGWVAAFASTGG